jgi:glucose-6-phosphate isomerase
VSIKLDISGMQPDDTLLDALAPRAQEAVAGAREMVARGVLGFRELEAHAAERARMQAWAASVRGDIDDIVVLGIGGSALGAVCLRTALQPNARLHVLDNVDPRSVRGVLDSVDLKRTKFLVVSKSGSTAETMAQYLLVSERLKSAGLAAKDYLVFITDPAKGALRAAAKRDGVPAFEVPANVGGRFSVLSPVGTLPAALLGLDVDALIAGAAAMRDRCAGASLREDPALAFAALQWNAHTQQGQGSHVLMPYSDALRDLGPWFVQLWAESLGKKTASGVHVGPTPISAVGATDQHAQVQLFMEGPLDKTVTFVDVESHPDDLEIPVGADAPAELKYLKGRTFGELLRTECAATAAALAAGGRPTMTIRVSTVDAWHLGGLFMFLELATIYAGQLYGVDPLNQPGVELGKQLTYYQFGHPDWQSMKPVWDSLPKSDPRWVL